MSGSDAMVLLKCPLCGDEKYHSIVITYTQLPTVTADQSPDYGGLIGSTVPVTRVFACSACNQSFTGELVVEAPPAGMVFGEITVDSSSKPEGDMP